MPKATIISEYAKEIAGLLSQRTSFFWNEVGSVSLTPIVDRHPNFAYLFPERLIHPLLPKDQPKLLSKELSPSEVIPEDAITLMLFHRIFEGKHPKAGRGFRDFSRKDIIESDTLLGKCVREIGVDL